MDTVCAPFTTRDGTLPQRELSVKNVAQTRSVSMMSTKIVLLRNWPVFNRGFSFSLPEYCFQLAGPDQVHLPIFRGKRAVSFPSSSKIPTSSRKIFVFKIVLFSLCMIQTGEVRNSSSVSSVSSVNWLYFLEGGKSKPHREHIDMVLCKIKRWPSRTKEGQWCSNPSWLGSPP